MSIAASHFSRLNDDAIQGITSLLPIKDVLTLTTVSLELNRAFSPAVIALAVSKVSLRGRALRPVLKALSRRYPLLTDLDLSNSGATDADVSFVASNFAHLTQLSLDGCDAVSDAALAR